MSNTAGKRDVVQDSRPAADGTGFTKRLKETDAFSASSMALPPEEKYNMDKGRRGLALIFNQEDERLGSGADCSNMEERLTGLGFEVKVFTNSTINKVNEEIDKAAKADHSDADCFLLVFMSHGEDRHVYVKDGKIRITNITDKFKGTNCKSLVGKPKIFIWQACRGNKNDDPVTPCSANNEDTEEEKEVVETKAVHTLPAGADFIMCYSVAEGYYSYRNIEKGSWYIQDLCELLQTYGDSLEFTQLLTLVNRKVSMRSVRTSKDASSIGKKQVPCFASMLTKKLYFHPKRRGKKGRCKDCFASMFTKKLCFQSNQ